MNFRPLFLILLFFTPLLRAESLEEVTRAALANNASIRAATSRWNAARARVPQAAAWDDLKVSADSRLARFVRVAPDSFTDQTLAVEQMIPVSGKNRSRARVAAAEALSAFEDVRRRQLDVVVKTRAAYFRLANAQAQIELNRKSFVSLRQIAEAARSGYEVGTRTVADVFTAENEASRLLENRRDLERAVAEGQSQLNVLMNRDAFAPLGQPEESAVRDATFSLPELRALMLAHRPEIRIAQSKVAAETARLQLARRDWIPDPAVNLKAQRYNSAAQAASELDAGVSFSVPWLNARKYSAENAEAAENLAAAGQDLRAAQTEAAGLLRDALQKIETAHHHVELFRARIVPLARQTFDVTQLGYESGKSGFPEWLTAQRNLRDAEAMAREHLADYQIAVAELEGVVGAELPAQHSH